MKDIFNYALIILNIWILITGDFKTPEETYYIELKGYVNNPGVYKVTSNDTVDEIIKKHGGLKEEADTSVTNLSKKLKDGDVVIIYSKAEIEEMKNGSTAVKYIDKECICPTINNSVNFVDKINKIDEMIVKTGKISLNSATLEELMTLPGIGEAKAKLIIEYRDINNGFKTIEEITNVKGIGKANFEKIKNYLTR